MGDSRAVRKAAHAPEESGAGDEPLAVHERPLDVRTIITCAIDDIALAALRDRQAERIHCAVCDDVIEGEAHSTGLMMWTRGDDVRYDEPPLCGPCASSISVSAWTRWQYFTD